MSTKPGVLSLSILQAKVLVNILVRISVKGVANVPKSRLQQLIATQVEDFDKVRLALIEEHGQRDDTPEKNLVKVGEGQAQRYVMKDEPTFQAAFAELQAAYEIEIGTEDPVKEKAVKAGYELLSGEKCPDLTPEESMLLIGLIDAFEVALPAKAEPAS